MSVLVSRALPDVRDGLKPSQRRILVAMNDLGLGPNAGTKEQTIARIYGVGFALPAPGLRPNRQEWQDQRESVANAIELLEQRGIEADGDILATRKATRRIVGTAKRLGCEAIVMAADPPRNRLLADLMWSQEPYRVRRRARVPVHLVQHGDGQ